MNRWGIAAAGVLLQIALGAVYAWSVFRVPSSKAVWVDSAITAAGMVGIVSFGNALGRVFWAWLSNIVTRRMTF